VERRRVGPLELSPVGVGTAPIGSDPAWHVRWGVQDERAAIAALRLALALGANWIDTAPFYGWGRAEELVGKAVGPRRDDVLLFTKCGTLRNQDGTSREDHRPASIRADLDASLRRLRTDYVDVLHLHDPDPSIPIEESWGTVQELIDAGKVRHGGLSNHTPAAVERALAVGPVAVIQHQYSLLVRGVENDIVPLAERQGLGLLCWSPLASGFLAAGFDVDQLDADDFRRRHPFAELDLAPLRAKLRELGDAHGRSAAQVAIAWILSRAPAAGAIVGVRNAREAEELPGCADFRLEPGELRGLEAAAP
jgi:aryl-alcohol dehydrogenase-like predicted oxidoreductase